MAPRPAALALSNIQPYGAHEIQRIASGDDAGLHAVIEYQPAVFKAIFEVDVDGRGSHFVGHARERKVVGGGQTDGSFCQQGTDETFGADGAIVRIGAAQQFVQQEERRGEVVPGSV